MKIPKGGTPVIARKPIIKRTAVTGNTDITPFTFFIFVELNVNKIFPADKNKMDFANEW